VLTKYQLAKKVRWYHWEVVDANCCGCARMIDDTASDNTSRGEADEPAIIKPAPESAKIGDAMPVSADERTKLAAMFNSNQN
jgi:hypothetical protein